MAPLAAVGAVLFYISDASLALNRFRQPIPHSALLAMGVYWLGQLGIAIAAAACFLRPVGRVGPQRARADARDRRLAEAEEMDLVEQRVHPADGDAVVLVARRGVVNDVVLGREDQACPLQQPHPRRRVLRRAPTCGTGSCRTRTAP